MTQEEAKKKAGWRLGILILLIMAGAIAWSNFKVREIEPPRVPTVVAHPEPTQPSDPRAQLRQTLLSWPDCTNATVTDDRVVLEYKSYQRSDNAESEALTAAQQLAAVRSIEGKGYANVSVLLRQHGTNRYSMTYLQGAVKDATWY